MAQKRVDALDYRSNVLTCFEQLLADKNVGKALDVGAGDGWLAHQLQTRAIIQNITGLDIQVRKKTWHQIQLYDGKTLPFADQSFDLVYAVDALHHADDPEGVLREMLRCASRWLLIKDHTFSTFLGWATLSALDELGNRRLGIPSIYKYQKKFSWIEYIEANGFRRVQLVYPFAVEKRFWGRITNRLQFSGLWCRE